MGQNVTRVVHTRHLLGTDHLEITALLGSLQPSSHLATLFCADMLRRHVSHCDDQILKQLVGPFYACRPHYTDANSLR